MHKNLVFSIIILFVLGFTTAYLVWRPTAPAVTFTNLEGTTLSLSDWRGKPALVTFWASDCATCLKEIPALKSLHMRYAPKGLHLIAVAMAYDMPSHVLSLSKMLELPYDVALDPLGEHAQAFYHVQWTPTTFLIGPDGHILQRWVGAFDPLALAEQIEFLLEH